MIFFSNSIKKAIKAYRAYIKDQFETLHIIGMRQRDFKQKLSLEKIYVKLRAQESIADITRLELDELFQQKGDEDLVEVFKRTDKKILILGEPGSGKTTMMKWLALQCIEDGVFTGDYIPVFITLKELISNFKQENPKDLKEWFCEVWENKRLVKRLWQSQFDKGKLLFLFDSLDEIGSEAMRKAALVWLEKQYFGNNRWIVTSRHSGLYGGISFKNDVDTFCIQNFEMEDVKHFLQNWYYNISIAEGKKNTDVARQFATVLFNAIEDKKNVTKLAINPLLLTLIAVIHYNKGVLPEARHELYYEAICLMIKRRIKIPGKQEKQILEQKLEKLGAIAVFLMGKQKETGEKIELNTNEIEEVDAGFIHEIQEDAGILYYSEGQYGFIHQTFQEYLAAYYYAHSKEPLDILVYFHKAYWTETFKLFVNVSSIDDVKKLYETIIVRLASKKYTYWKNMNLLEDCLEEIVVNTPQKKAIKEELEREFAKKIIEALLSIPYNTIKEDFIIELYPYYALYTQAKKRAFHKLCLQNNEYI